MKLSKKIITLCLLVLFLLAGMGVFAQTVQQIAASVVSSKIFLNGKELSFKMPVVAIDDRIYVPLREFAEELGMSVEWDGVEKKVELSGNTTKEDDVMIRMMVFPSSVRGLAFQVDLYDDGQLSTAVGTADSMALIDGTNYTIIAKDFNPKLTRYTKLTVGEMEELTSLASQITIEEKWEGCVDDGWFVTITYKGETFHYDYGYWDCSEHMREIMLKLFASSPIKIVTHNYEDPKQVEYYRDFEW